MMEILQNISECVQKGKAKAVREGIQKALEEGISPVDILEQGLIAGMNEIGKLFKEDAVFVPEVLVAARAMTLGVQTLRPYLVQFGHKTVGRACIGTVQGDLHDIGKNLVKLMLEGKGIEVIDLGVDVTPQQFVDAAVSGKCQLICCSALLTTTMPVMQKVVEAVKAAGIRDQVKIMIGGAPVTQSYCDFIGADAYTPDAADCAEAAMRLIAQLK